MSQYTQSGNGDRESSVVAAAIEPVVDHGWGDLRTWAIIGALTMALLVLTFIMYYTIGKPTMQNWNLGSPPTAPSFIVGM